MASPFPNFEVGDIVDVSLHGGGLLDDVIITYVPVNSPNESLEYWEFFQPSNGSRAIVSNFVAMIKKA